MREPKPITHVEVSEKNRILRIICAVVLLVIGVLALTVAFQSLLGKETGWQEVQFSSKERNCSEDFLFRYNFSGSGAEITAVNRKLEQIYEDGCVKGYQLFTPDEGFDGVQNIYYVNHHVNETVTVDPVLYRAFQKLEGTRWLYLGPVYAHYYNIFYNADAYMVEALDPALSQEASAYLAKIAAFAADPEAIHLELLDNYQVKLHVSDAYLAFAGQEEIENFIDFAYLTNAFIIDYLADNLAEQGLTNGYLVSTDGYTRNLDSENAYSFTIFDRDGSVIYPAGVMEYHGPVSIVFLKDYSTTQSDLHYRASGDHMIHLFADPADGMYRTSTENLVGYSYNSGCADVALKMLPSFVGDQFAVPEGVFSIWCQDETIFYNDESIRITNLLKGENVTYKAVLKQ